MSKPDIKNLPASILDRLMNQSQITGRNYNELLQYYVIERLLYRLGSGGTDGYNREMKCPKCGVEEKQNKIGKTSAGSQRYRCFVCQCKYTPEKKKRGYGPELHQQALRFYVDGMNLRRIGRHLGIHHRTVSDWVKAYAESLPDAPVPDKVEIAEMDELFTFIGDKKTGSI